MGPLEDDEGDIDSSDEALCEILGLTSLKGVAMDENDKEFGPRASPLNSKNESGIPEYTPSALPAELRQVYGSESVCIFPRDLSIPAEVMRRLTDELVWGRDVDVDKTYETIRVMKNGEIEERRTLTRLENFVNHHKGWNELCHVYLQRCISDIMGTEMVLYKEKLNLKPPGGSGFAPHLDTPSLRVALGDAGPQAFVTVMVAIDDMTARNGCLRVAKGCWSETNHCDLVLPEQDGNPDAGGRAGAIQTEAAEPLEFENITCRGGDIVVFNGWAPHRSSSNSSPFPRRAVFLTYNPKSEGNFHDRYYERMKELRNEWRSRIGLDNHRQLSLDEKLELEALETVPK